MKWKTFIILLLIYAGSCVLAWSYFSAVFSKGGRFETLEPGSVEVVITFTPLINTVFGGLGWLDSPYKDKRQFNKFFNIESK